MLAQAAAPLQMLINDQVIKQGNEAKSFMSNVFSGFGLGAKKGSAKDASSISANPLTGTAVTAPTAEAPVSASPNPKPNHSASCCLFRCESALLAPLSGL